MTAAVTDLPMLFVVRGWSEEVDPNFVVFMDELRDAGHEIVDIFGMPDGYRDFGEWGDDLVAEIERRTEPGTPLHLLGYCYGGNLLMCALAGLEARGADIEYVAFLDMRRDSPEMRLQRGLDSLYGVPWGMRVRQQLLRLVPPYGESFAVVARSVVQRAIRSTLEFPSRGWRSRKRRIPAIHQQLTLSLSWEFSAITTPAHSYVCRDSIDRYAPGDPSLGQSIRFHGGNAVRFIDGTHATCICPPQSAGLIELITTDRLVAAELIGLQL